MMRYFLYPASRDKRFPDRQPFVRGHALTEPYFRSAPDGFYCQGNVMAELSPVEIGPKMRYALTSGKQIPHL
jgi:hypothetical protein